MPDVLAVVVDVTPESVVCRTTAGGRAHVQPELCDIEPAIDDVVQLQAESDGWLLYEPPQRSLRAIACTAVRPQQATPVVVFDAGRGPGRISLECRHDDLGVVDRTEAQRLQSYDRQFRLIVNQRGQAVDLVWPEGGLAAVREEIERRARADEERKHRQSLTEARARAARPDVFVNPYTYVPFPATAAARQAPRGHDHLAEGTWCGWFNVSIEALTPLLIRYPAENGSDGTYVFPRRDGRPYIPGSSLKGVVRSLHETLTGSCLRVVDLDHLPVYRDTASQRSDGWTLARVDEVGHENRAERVRLCDTVVWARATDLHDALGGPSHTCTGAEVSVDDARTRAARTEATQVSAGAGWVVLITDVGPRDPNKPHRCATGHLSSVTAKVTDDAWRTYLDAVEGTDDLRRARQRGDADLTVPRCAEVRHGDDLIGWRRTAARGFKVGDIIWVRAQAGQVQEIALSYIWRTAGSSKVGERVPDGFHPCTDRDELCPSCRLLGMADPDGDAPGERPLGEPARQEAYRGHVRFGDATTTEPVEIRAATLAPQARPGLRAGQFSLQHRDDLQARDLPTNRWGADPDRTHPRQLRGRRMYWHGDPEAQRQAQQVARHEPREHQSENMITEVELVHPPATFTARIHFSGLTPAELGSLLASVAPASLLDDLRPDGYSPEGEIAARIGGGKPFGFGTARTSITDLHVDDARSRYGGGDPPTTTPGEAVAAFRSDEPVQERMREVWRALAAVLHTGQVNPERIWYPPGTAWDRVGTPEFDEPYAFFQQSAGAAKGGGGGDMIPLPDPQEPDQSLDIRTKTTTTNEEEE